MTINGPVALTVVMGGATPPTVEETSASTLTVEDRVRPVHAECGWGGFELWEAVAHVSRLEAFLDREIDEHEIEDVCAEVMRIKDEFFSLSASLAGVKVFVPCDDAEFVVPGTPQAHRVREEYEERGAVMREKRRIPAAG